VVREYKSVPLRYREYSDEEMLKRSEAFYNELKQRRTVRTFSDKEVPREVIKNCIKAAGTAPNGANLQPWHFVVVSDKQVKSKIREAAEKEEYEFYHGKAPDDWINALEHLGTDEHKPFLEKAPYLIVIFEKKYEETEQGKIKHYYTKESVGIAAGFLINALHHAGLVSLTHTPSPMNFLNDILKRPSNEKPFLILVVGFPEENTTVPDIRKKTIEEITSFI
jgi:iodotyrosine deiodinase